jgi:hypothetical protein
MTQVRYHETSPTKCSGENVKKLLLQIIEANNPEYFGRRIKANRTKMLVTDLGNGLFDVRQYETVKHSWEPYERETHYIFEVKV